MRTHHHGVVIRESQPALGCELEVVMSCTLIGNDAMQCMDLHSLHRVAIPAYKRIHAASIEIEEVAV